MAEYDWLPYLEGKYMTYYQIMALIFSAIAILFSLICFTIFLLISKLNPHSKFKDLLVRMIFYSLALIPLICMAFDVVGLI